MTYFENALHDRVVTNSVVYHYTKCWPLLNIIKTNRLRGYQASSLSDRDEVHGGWVRMHDLIESNPGTEALVALKDVMPGLDDLRTQTASSVYVLCASTEEDDTNQWGLYGEGGNGYCIGLDPSASLAVAATEYYAKTVAPAERAEHERQTEGVSVRVPFAHAGAELHPWRHVIYRDEELLEVMKRIGTAFLADRDICSGPHTSQHELDDYVLQAADDARSALEVVANLVKAPGYSGENEVRVVVLNSSTDVTEFEDSARGIRTFLDIASPGDDRSEIVGMLQKPPALPIVSVTSGARLDEAQQRINIRSLLMRHGHKRAETKRSRLHLR